MNRNTAEAWRRVVAIETSARRGSIALLWDGERHERELGSSNAHAKDLLPELRDILQDLDAWSGSGVLPLDGVIAGTGPGSYTGLRIGIATAEGLARGSGAALLGVPSFEALAHRELAAGESAAIALDARASRFYFARYRREQFALVTLTEPCVLTATELARELQHDERVLVDAGLPACAGLEESAVRKLIPAGPPAAGSVLDLGLAAREQGETARYGSVAPLYLRAFGA